MVGMESLVAYLRHCPKATGQKFDKITVANILTEIERKGVTE
jgi:hypothetical protein